MTVPANYGTEYRVDFSDLQIMQWAILFPKQL